jgi:hypothetical protein
LQIDGIDAGGLQIARIDRIDTHSDIIAEIATYLCVGTIVIIVIIK